MEGLIEWPGVASHLLEFVGAFLAAGAIGFRYTALRRLPDGGGHSPRAIAGRTAAVLGAIGALVGLWHLYEVLPRAAQRSHVSVGELLTTPNVTSAWLVLSVLALLGFLLAFARVDAGWALAAVGVIAGSLRNGLVGQFSRLVTPVHMLAGGLWIGTLFVLVVAGIGTVMRHEPTDRRGARVAEMVNAFSPLALAMGGTVVLFGLIAAWRELGRVDALWTTPFGIGLMVKLVFVALVFALGAWNWRRQRPSLGTESAAVSIRRSARAELTVAALVLVATAVMVGLPKGDEGERPGPSAPSAAGAPSTPSTSPAPANPR
jgi:putative copper export protein